MIPDAERILNTPELYQYAMMMKDNAYNMAISMTHMYCKETIYAGELLYRIYIEAYKIRNEHWEKVVDCKAGCNHCCHLRVSVNCSEIIALVYWLKKYCSKAKINRIIENLKQYQKEKYLLTETWVHEAQHCVFLSTDGKCSIYRFRPLACRAFNSCNAERCREGSRRKKDCWNTDKRNATVCI